VNQKLGYKRFIQSELVSSLLVNRRPYLALRKQLITLIQLETAGTLCSVELIQTKYPKEWNLSSAAGHRKEELSSISLHYSTYTHNPKLELLALVYMCLYASSFPITHHCHTVNHISHSMQFVLQQYIYNSQITVTCPLAQETLSNLTSTMHVPKEDTVFKEKGSPHDI
jgi:hypothetical protein